MLCSSSLKAIRSGESAVEIKLSLWAQQRFSGPCWLAIEPASPPLFSFRNIWVGSNCNKIQARRDTHTLEHTESRYTLYTQRRVSEHAHTYQPLWLYLDRCGLFFRSCERATLREERRNSFVSWFEMKHSPLMEWNQHASLIKLEPYSVRGGSWPQRQKG